MRRDVSHIRQVVHALASGDAIPPFGYVPLCCRINDAVLPPHQALPNLNTCISIPSDSIAALYISAVRTASRRTRRELARLENHHRHANYFITSPSHP